MSDIVDLVFGSDTTVVVTAIQLDPTPFVEVDDMGEIIGITRHGLLIHTHNGGKFLSGYTLDGYGVENLSEKERTACRL